MQKGALLANDVADGLVLGARIRDAAVKGRHDLAESSAEQPGAEKADHGQTPNSRQVPTRPIPPLQTA